MRKLSDPMLISKSILLGVLALMLGTPALAGTAYRWVTESGTVAYTDDAKRIPARYRAQAERRPTGRLSSYARYTPKDDDAGETYAERVRARVLRLRELNEALEARPAKADAVAGYEQVLRLNRRSSIRVQTPADAHEPVTFHNTRVRPKNSMVTRHVTVVRQGDRVLSVIRPPSSVQPLNVPDESDLLE